MNDLEFFLAFCHRRFSRSLAAARDEGLWIRQGPENSRIFAVPPPGLVKSGVFSDLFGTPIFDRSLVKRYSGR
jgi:hypothetical protein